MTNWNKEDLWYFPKIVANDGQLAAYKYPTSKVVCVGRNYVAHAKELNNPVPSEPLLFLKPNSTLSDLCDGICLPDVEESCHHELEVAVLIGKKCTAINESEVDSAVAGIGIGLDLTLRELQLKLKNKGQPWEKAKSFDGSCPVSEFLPMAPETDFEAIEFQLVINGQIVQSGTTGDMIFNIPFLIAEASRHFTLYPGDILLTGTPSGVGKLSEGDLLELSLNQTHWTCKVE